MHVVFLYRKWWQHQNLISRWFDESSPICFNDNMFAVPSIFRSEQDFPCDRMNFHTPASLQNGLGGEGSGLCGAWLLKTCDLTRPRQTWQVCNSPFWKERRPCMHTLGILVRRNSENFCQITKGSVSYLSSPCFSTIIGGIGGASPGETLNSRRYVLDINYKGGGPPLSIPTGDAVTGPHIRGTLSMREMSL